MTEALKIEARFECEVCTVQFTCCGQRLNELAGDGGLFCAQCGTLHDIDKLRTLARKAQIGCAMLLDTLGAGQ
jgi:hypothetical protein